LADLFDAVANAIGTEIVSTGTLQRTITDNWQEAATAINPTAYLEWNDFVTFFSDELARYVKDPANLQHYADGLREAAKALRR